MVISVVLYLALLFGVVNEDINYHETNKSDTCQISASLKTEDVENGVRVTIQIKGDIDNMKFFFCNEKGNLVSDQSNSNTIVLKNKGSYYCILSKNSDCFKKIEFEL